MTTTFKEEKVITMDTKCDNCGKKIFRGFEEGKLNNGRVVIFCEMCH